mgnify:CR=1 FL=1
MNEHYKTFPVGTRVEVIFPGTWEYKEFKIMAIVIETNQDIPGWEYWVAVELDHEDPWGHKVRYLNPRRLTKV